MIIVSSILDSRMKILYIKKTILEERKKYFEIFGGGNANLKNIIIIVKTINQQSGLQGFLYDKDWRQIYMDSTLTPESHLDNIKTYLVPHEEVVKNDEIMQFIIDANISPSI